MKTMSNRGREFGYILFMFIKGKEFTRIEQRLTPILFRDSYGTKILNQTPKVISYSSFVLSDYCPLLSLATDIIVKQMRERKPAPEIYQGPGCLACQSAIQPSASTDILLG
jgi:hypothetical protein